MRAPLFTDYGARWFLGICLELSRNYIRCAGTFFALSDFVFDHLALVQLLEGHAADFRVVEE